jgi:hypothetical protein
MLWFLEVNNGIHDSFFDDGFKGQRDSSVIPMKIRTPSE